MVGTERGHSDGIRMRTRAAPGLFMLTVVFALLLFGGCAAHDVSPLAMYRDAEDLHGQYIGGGDVFGEPRRVHEGVWCFDYAGPGVFRTAQMRWSHSRKHRQGGIGSY